MFFFADNGYPDYNRLDPETGQPVAPFCDTGAGCVYARYAAAPGGDELPSAGVTDAASFSDFDWSQQFSTALTLIVLTEAGALLGGLGYGFTRPKARPATSSVDGAHA